MRLFYYIEISIAHHSLPPIFGFSLAWVYVINHWNSPVEFNSLIAESKINLDGIPGETKDIQFVRWMTQNVKLQLAPLSSFYSEHQNPESAKYIRLCFVKVKNRSRKDISVHNISVVNLVEFVGLSRSYYIPKNIMRVLMRELFFQVDEKLEKAAELLKKWHNGTLSG